MLPCHIHGPGGCSRVHKGDVVKVVLGPQLGYGQTGKVIDEPDDHSYLVEFFEPVDDGDGNQFTALYYSESELEIDGIARHYREAQHAQDQERKAHLAAGHSIQSFVPKTLID